MKSKMFCMFVFLLTVFLFLNFTALAEPPVGNSLQDFKEMTLGIFEVDTDTLDLLPLIGIWENIDPNTGGIIRIIITGTDGQLVVHPFGACHPDPCDWGRVYGIPYAINAADGTAIAFSSFFDPGYKETILIGIRRPGLLTLQHLNMFKDGSGRSNYIGIDHFVRRQ